MSKLKTDASLLQSCVSGSVILDSIEKILNPEYLNSEFTWIQFKKAFEKANTNGLLTPELRKQMFVDYVHEFAWEFGRLWNTELSHEQKMERIGEKFKLPDEFISEFF